MGTPGTHLWNESSSSAKFARVLLAVVLSSWILLNLCFHLLEGICVFSLLALNGIYSYLTCCGSGGGLSRLGCEKIGSNKEVSKGLP